MQIQPEPHYAIHSHLPPVIFNSTTSDKIYAVSGGTWVEIGPDVTLEMVRKAWVPKYPSPERVQVLTAEEHFIAKSSRTNEEYVVTKRGDSWSCECMGFGFRGKCKHIEQFKIQK